MSGQSLPAFCFDVRIKRQVNLDRVNDDTLLKGPTVLEILVGAGRQDYLESH